MQSGNSLWVERLTFDKLLLKNLRKIILKICSFAAVSSHGYESWILGVVNVNWILLNFFKSSYMIYSHRRQNCRVIWQKYRIPNTSHNVSIITHTLFEWYYYRSKFVLDNFGYFIFLAPLKTRIYVTFLQYMLS